jgi:hypothetical protein
VRLKGGLEIASRDSSTPPELVLNTATDEDPPGAPDGLVATVLSSGSIGLDWLDNGEGDLGGYNVYRGTQSGFTAGPSNRIASGVVVSQFTDTGLSPGTSYFYRVTAVDTSGNESAVSVEAAGTTLPAPAIQTLRPTADTFVRQNDAVVYGGSDGVLVKNDSSNTRQGYIRFDTSGVSGGVSQVLLRLRVETSPNWPGGTTIEALEFFDSSWSESMNWFSRPSDGFTGSVLGSVQAPVVTPTTWEVDVTDYVLAQRAAGQLVVSFTFRSTVRLNGGLEIASRESSTPPELELQVQ